MFIGMYAPPTMMFALRRSLKLAGDYFDEKGWPWTQFGGGTLGAIKNRGFIPWEAGDIDVNSNVTKKEMLDKLRTEFVKRYPDFQITDHSKREIIIKPKRGFGGWVTIFFEHSYTPMVRYMRIKTDDYWCAVTYDVFKEARIDYGRYYLQHKMYNKKALHCEEKSNTCLPNFNELFGGRGGMWREFFVEK